jgi:tetratricopeptide (TPR) repeat protein
MRVGLVLAAAVLATAGASAQGGRSPQLAQANAALQNGAADKALGLLNPLMQTGDKAEALNLGCRVEYQLEQWEKASDDCEQAVKLDRQNSGYHLWLGRTLGARASRASFLSAYSLAKRVRAEFEEAVRLNPLNADALADLGEFYYSAPGVLGGGVDKAAGVALQLDKFDPMRARELRARIAEERKDYGTAEREFKQLIASAPHPAFEWIKLAGYYRRHARWAEMESAIASGQAAAERDRQANPALFDGAALLIQTNRDSQRAAKMLEEYLAGRVKSEDAPTFVAHTWLARLKQQLGDTAAVDRERAAALALAQEYKPAQAH